MLKIWTVWLFIKYIDYTAYFTAFVDKRVSMIFHK